MPLLFAYGTLRDQSVQRATFGRELPGRPDSLPGFRSTLLEITDPPVRALSGRAQHPVLRATGDPADRIAGTAFELTGAELQLADDYEVGDYQRIQAPLRSGDPAWVYVSAADATAQPEGSATPPDLQPPVPPESEEARR